MMPAAARQDSISPNREGARYCVAPAGSRRAARQERTHFSVFTNSNTSFGCLFTSTLS